MENVFPHARIEEHEPEWQALAREATSSAEHIAFGATVLGRANYAQSAYYAQAFFSLSIGFERAGKLALIVDHALGNNGAYPSSDTLRRYGHDLKKLLFQMEETARRRGIAVGVPNSHIHAGIIDTLSEFATNVTRYYNLELVTDAPSIAARDDPISAWFRRVTLPVLREHYKERFRARDEAQAQLIDDLISDFTLVRHQTETGETIDTPFEAAARTAATQFSKRWERMYVLQIARFVVGEVLGELGYVAQEHQVPDIPYFSEMFGIFDNHDAYLRERKTWSIY